MRDGPRDFRQDSSCPALLRILLARTPLTRTGLSPSAVKLSRLFRFDRARFSQSYNPGAASTTPVWALSVSLATTREIDSFFLFLQVLRCFSSLRWLQLRWCQLFKLTGSPIRTSPDLHLFAVPRGFSQLSTSFLASKSLGILHPLFFASLCFLLAVRSSSLVTLS